jgi:hypothetical protein
MEADGAVSRAGRKRRFTPTGARYWALNAVAGVALLGIGAYWFWVNWEFLVLYSG